MSKNSFDDLVDEALTNIRLDRSRLDYAITTITTHLDKNQHEHKESGFVLAKYCEAVQRSNEQIIKILNLLNKRTGSEGITDADKEEIAEILDQELE